MARNEQAKATIYLDGKQAEAALDGLKNRAKLLRDELKKAQAAGDIIKTKKLQSELKGVESAQRSLRKETFDYEKVLRNINGASMSELKKSLRTVEVQLNKMKRTDPGYLKKQAEAKQFRAEINRINTELRGQPSLASRAAQGFNKYFGILTAGIAAFTGILFSAKEFIKGIVGLDDSLANVMKTTSLTRKEVREMYTDFRTFNTRTPRRELLELAEEAGRLGRRGRKDIMDFVEVANQIKVALGDDLGGDAGVAIREVGKLTEIYKISAQYGTEFKESMLKVGSAINEVSANSNAQAPYLIDYLKRMGGIAGQMKVTAAETIGYASTLDQLGQSQEMAATAQGKLMVDMFKDQAKYAAIAKMSTEEFTRLLETDANEAFLTLLEGLNGNNEGFSVMAQKLDGMGIDGARAVQVLSVLSANTKMVREQQDLANDAMDKGISLTNEYNIKNNNLAGSVQKIGQYLHSKFINSSFLGWLEKVVGKVGEWTEIKLSDTLIKERTELNSLVTSIISASENQRVRNSLITELQSKYPDFLGNIDAEKVSNEQLKSMLVEVNAQYRERIKLAALHEKTTKIQEKGIDLAAKEQKIVEDVNKLYQQFRYEGLAPANTFEEQLAAFDKAGKQHGFIAKGVLAGVKSLGKEYDSVQEKIEANIAEYEKWSALANNVQMKLNPSSPGAGTGSQPPSPGTGTGPGAGTGGSGATPAAAPSTFPAIKKSLETAFAQEQNLLKEQFLKKTLTQAQYNQSLYVLEMAHLTAMRDLHKRSGEDITAIDSQILDKKLAWTKQIDAMLGTSGTVSEKLLTEEGNMFDEIDRQMEKHVQDYEKAMDAKADAIIDSERRAFEFEQEINAARQDLKAEYIDAVGQVAGALSDMFEQGSAAQIAMLAIEKAAAIAQIIFQTGIANAKAVAASPLTAGQPWVTINTISAGASIAAIVATTVGQISKGSKAKNVKSKADGGFAGYTGPGGKYEEAELVQLHKSEYVIPQEGTQNPQLKPVIDIMEIARRSGTLARLDLRQIMQAIPAKQYASGGFASAPPASPPPYQGGVPAGGGGSYDPELTTLIRENLKTMKELQKLKVSLSLETFEKERGKYIDIKQTSGL